MKISLHQLVIAFLFMGAAMARETVAQEILERRVTIQVSGEKLKTVLNQLSKQAQVRFTYSSAIVQTDQKVSFSARNLPLAEVLDGILSLQQISYKVEGRQIILTKLSSYAPPVPDFTGNPAGPAAEPTVTGTVTDENGAPLPGVNVLVKGTTAGTSTSAEGRYSLTVPDGNVTLVFSFIGYTTEEVAVNGRSVIDLKLVPDIKSLNEIVVVGYGTQKRSDITGSVTSVSKDRLSNLPVTNVLQGIQGAVAGVNITQNSSVPGSPSTSINVRGARSISANNDPYVILDGVPFPGAFNDINPNDIASMEILKDASAVAIYGTRGANGVILITTKRGKTGKPVIQYNTYAGPEFKSHVLQPMNGQQYAEKYSAFTQQMGLSPDPVPNYAELVNYQAGRETDWLKEVSQQGFIHDHSISVSGGTNDVKYYVGGEYLKQEGVLKGYQFERMSIRTNLDAQLNSWLSMGTSLFFVSNNSDGGRVNLNWTMAMSPYGQLYNSTGGYELFPMKPELLFVNPLLGLNSARLDRRKNFTGTFYTEVQPSFMKGLKFRLNANYAYLPARFSSYTGRNTNDLLGTAVVHNTEGSNYTIENILTYTRDWQKHHVDVTALYSAQQSDLFNSSLTARSFINDQLDFYNVTAGQMQQATPNDPGDPINPATSSNPFNKNGYFKTTLLSQMMRVNYSFAGKYLLTVTARRDGSSVFGAATSKYATFPSVAVGWNLGDENFARSITAINALKLRASYGTAGNQAIGPYQTLTTQALAPYVYNGATTIGIIPSNLGNPGLKWESTTSLNVGVDFALLKNRVSGTLEVYQSKTKDLLLRRQLPRITGYSSIWDNVGKTQNQGIELTLNTVNIERGSFTWETGLNFSANQNKIVELYGDSRDDIGNLWFIGKPLNAVYDYRMTGVWQVGEDAASQDPGAKPGDLRFADLNNDGKITSVDREYLGSRLPLYIGGLTNTLKYKNFRLNVFLQTFQGSLKPNQMLNRADFAGRTNQAAAIGYWTEENRSNTRPALRYTNPRGYGYPSNSSYTRIKDVTLGYTIPQGLLDKYRLGSLMIYVSGRNIHTFTDWIGWDPEVNWDSTADSSNNRNNYPNVASYVLGLNIGLR